MKRRHFFWVVACGVALVLAGGVSVSLATSASQVGRRDHGISAQLVRHFHLFADLGRRREHTPRELAARAAPNKARRAVQSMLASLASADDPSNERQHLDVGATQVVAESAGTVWAIPGADGMCVATATPTATSGPLAGQAIPYAVCGSASAADSAGMIGVGLDPDRSHLMYGVVPNGVVRVDVLVDGSTESFAVTDNAVTGVLPQLPTQVRLVWSDGTQTVALSGPG
jgi:hypothetical protein